MSIMAAAGHCNQKGTTILPLIKWSASAFDKYWMPKSSTQSVKVVLREVLSPESGGLGHALIAKKFEFADELVKSDNTCLF